MRLLVLAFLSFAASAAAEPYHLIPGAVPLDSGPDGNTIVLDAPQGAHRLRHRPPPRACAGDPRLCEGAAPADRGDRQLALAPRPYDRELGHPPGLSARPDLREQCARRRARDLPQEEPRRHRQDARRSQNAARGARPARARNRGHRSSRANPPQPYRLQVRPNDHRRPPARRPPRAASRRPRATSGSTTARRRTAIVGDLVVGLVPFMDTACADGWSKALGEIAAAPFTTLIPGHGAVMTRADFRQWRTAYDNFIKCGRSSAPEKQCVAGWQQDAAKFIDADHKDYVRRRRRLLYRNPPALRRPRNSSVTASRSRVVSSAA